MKDVPAISRDHDRQILDIRQPEHAARLGEAFSRERADALASLAELEAMRYDGRQAREQTALATMLPMPGHALMDRAPREVLRLRAALFLVSCHEHRKN
ncbi:hypothetical protein DFW101_0226 [Solidesulfovibrio carbinoliphilus subsp. oakridgensis]|uniref:Uncharacterized protein n=1 Tax=Solidesulfovibrio carbinoliphilus subsp. oakridgensis TaxID=694327 RepID=G7QCT7_9BACT|nr:hypothetical protein [Solidesulfovibrio carbinoliphilus]EHJ46243.1 hypothetical protein DFW101_0226 [Solidesulfovibrio carbinoliphilus subsp. oakridgensis]